MLFSRFLCDEVNITTTAKETGIPMKCGSSRARVRRYVDSGYLRGRLLETNVFYNSVA
jgi:hypothetical protein